LVTILPSNQLNQLKRNSFPLNEIHQNVIEHQQKVAKPPQTQPTTCTLTGQQQLTPMIMSVVNANLPQFYATQFTPSNQQMLNNIPTPNQNNSTHSHSK